MKIKCEGILNAALAPSDIRAAFSEVRKLSPKLTEANIKLQLQFFIEKIIVDIFKDAVKNQQFNGRLVKEIYEPLSKKYKAKKPLATREMFYKNTGNLARTISYWSVGSTIFVGWNPSTKTTNILKYLDKGTLKMAARPLMSKIISDIVINFEDKDLPLYLKYIARLNK